MSWTHRRVLAAIALGAGVALAGNRIESRKGLTLDGARAVIDAVKAEACARRAPGGVVAVVDEGGNLVALERLDGTFPAGAQIAIGKARTAALFRKPTRVFEEIVNKGRTAMVALPDFTPLQGGVPILVGDEVVGALGVSGAASAQQDEELAQAGAAALARVAGTAEPVAYVDRETVATAFGRGAVLLDGGERGWMVHASRREGPGEAEVHEQETDIIYVLGGCATFVTGGTVLEGRRTGAGELRGSGIRDGETRKLSKGDVIVVPRGTPHWFQEVQAPFTYYVVKVRT
jgi:glc operon protein GlcG